LKILYIVTNLNRSAPNTVIINILLNSDVNNIEILSLNKSLDDNYKKVLEENNIKNIEFNSFKEAFFNLKNMKNKFSNFDILHLNGYHPNIYGYFLKKLNSNFKLISTCHSVENQEAQSHQFQGISNVKTKIRLFLQSYLYPKQEKVVGVSKQVEIYLKEIGCENSTTIYNGVDYSSFPKLKSKKSNKDFLDLCQVGHIINLKNQIFSIKLIINLKRKGLDVKLHLFGSYDTNDKYFLKLQDLIIKNNIEDNVIFYGSLPFDELFKNLQNMDIQLLPSLSEGLPLALLEAFYFELPAIVSQNGGMKEVIKDNKNGLVIDIDGGNSFDDIYDYINSKTYIEDGRRAREEALDTFSSEDMARNYLEEYGKIE